MQIYNFYNLHKLENNKIYNNIHKKKIIKNLLFYFIFYMYKILYIIFFFRLVAMIASDKIKCD